MMWLTKREMFGRKRPTSMKDETNDSRDFGIDFTVNTCQWSNFHLTETSVIPDLYNAKAKHIIKSGVEGVIRIRTSIKWPDICASLNPLPISSVLTQIESVWWNQIRHELNWPTLLPFSIANTTG